MNSTVIQDFDAAVLTAMTGACGVKPHSRILVTVSGGADSVALLAALKVSGFDCMAAHCNFHLRGKESDRDMLHVSAITKKLDVPLHIHHFDVHAECDRTGESLEMACRRLRYAWFHDLATEIQAAAIAVAHHRDDQAETFMLNALRGTGIAGMCGMAPRNGMVVRPLLALSRSQVEEYLDARALEYVTDSTNLLNDFKRNKIRNIILPVMNSEFPGATASILHTMENVRGNMALYLWAVNRAKKEFVRGNITDVAAMTASMPVDAATMALFEILRPYGFSATQVSNILSAGRCSDSRSFHGNECTGILKYGLLELLPAHETRVCMPVSLKESISGPVEIAVTEHHISAFQPRRDPRVIYLDASVLEGTPTFTIRSWEHGDTMQPFGMRGKKLLSDLYSDAHYTAAQKRQALVLTRDGKILWAIGLRAASAFPVTAQTHRYLRLELL